MFKTFNLFFGHDLASNDKWTPWGLFNDVALEHASIQCADSARSTNDAARPAFIHADGTTRANVLEGQLQTANRWILAKF